MPLPYVPMDDVAGGSVGSGTSGVGLTTGVGFRGRRVGVGVGVGITGVGVGEAGDDGATVGKVDGASEGEAFGTTLAPCTDPSSSSAHPPVQSTAQVSAQTQ